MPLINCEVNLILTWSSTFAITNSTSAGTFKTLCSCSNFINTR